MKLISFYVVALACCMVPLLAPAQETSGNQSPEATDPIVGRWRWFTNEFVFIRADGTLTKGGRVLGSWKCVNATEWPRKYVLNWGGAMWVDTLFLKTSCTVLSGKNQRNRPVHGTRTNPDTKSSSAADAPLGSGSLVVIAPSGTVPHVPIPARRPLTSSPMLERHLPTHSVSANPVLSAPSRPSRGVSARPFSHHSAGRHLAAKR